MDIVSLVFKFKLHAARRTVSSLRSRALFNVQAKSLKDIQVLVNVLGSYTILAIWGFSIAIIYVRVCKGN